MWLMSEHGAKWELADVPFKKGGEGGVYRVIGHEGLVAKIYQEGKLNEIRQEKLAYMASLYSDALQQLAWPQAVLRDPYGTIRGFVMQKFDATEDMAELLDGTGTQMKYAVDWRRRVIVALNLSHLVNEIHMMGQSIGDMNPKNFGVDMNSGFVCAFDTDSFHIRNQNTGKWYPCTVLDEHYIAPELQARMQQGARVDSLRPEQTFTVQTDRFALAVLIFQLLFLGVHPFTAARTPSRGSSVVIHRRETNIYQRMCPFFNPASGVTVPVYAPPLEIVPPAMRMLFRKAFLEDDRPGAQEWIRMLSQLMAQTERCEQGHYYGKYESGKACPWCAMARKSGGTSAGNGNGAGNSQSASGNRGTGSSSTGVRGTGSSAVGSQGAGSSVTGGPNSGGAGIAGLSGSYRLIRRETLQKAQHIDTSKAAQGYYDGSTPEKAITVKGKMKEGVRDRTVFTSKGKVTIPAGIEAHEMLHYQQGPQGNPTDLYLQQNLDSPNVFSWLGSIAGAMAWYFSDYDVFSILAGGFLGFLGGAFLDGLLSSLWKWLYRRQM